MKNHNSFGRDIRLTFMGCGGGANTPGRARLRRTQAHVTAVPL